MIKECEICGVLFKTYLSRIKIGKGKYCSRGCTFKSLTGRPSSKKGIKLNKKQISKLNLKGLELGRKWWKGKKRGPNPEHSKRMLGRIPWNKGVSGYSASLKGVKRIDMIGDKNSSWKGENVGYGALHDWVKARKQKPDNCQKCFKNKKLELANLSYKYKRDLSDWDYLCHSCHFQMDRKNGWGIATKKYERKNT
mgnify:CR=1 FL=1